MQTRNSFRIAIIIGMISAFCSVAYAQGNMQPGGNRGPGMGRMMMNGPMAGYGRMGGYGPMMGYDAEGMLDRIDGRLAFIKTELGIRADQTKQWDDLATVIKDSAEVHNSMMRSMMEDMHDGDYSKIPLPERLTTIETFMEARVEQIRSIREALEALYAVLDDDQKKTADEVILPAIGMGPGMGGMMQ